VTARKAPDDAFVDRVSGMMFGAAIGDALGSAFEFVSSRKIEAALGGPCAREYCDALAGSLMHPRPAGLPTDDTAMTLALVDALCDPGPSSVEPFHRRFVEALARGAGPVADLFWTGGPGGACIAMLRVGLAGAGPFESLDPNAGGNGAAMRAHPCGIFSDREAVAEVAALQARFSHPHRAAVASAQVVALVVHEALITGRLAADCPPEVRDSTMRRAWDEMHRGSERGARLPSQLVDVDMAGWNTVAAAHAIAALYEGDPEAGIGFAAASGKDTDTVASIVGAMLGAVHGRRALPQRWIDGLQGRDMIEQRVAALLLLI
jgi:ADP-ribosylglycohydrolase